MIEREWAQIDNYYEQLLSFDDEILNQANQLATTSGLPKISISAAQGSFLYLTALIQQSTKILEIGTLAAYSTIWLARALPKHGSLITIEYDRQHADVAWQNITNAGFDDIVDLKIGAALDILPDLADQAPFDMTFIDADKDNIDKYFTWAVKLSRPGSIIIIDNVVGSGASTDDNNNNPKANAIRHVAQLIKSQDNIEATVMQTVGVKGHDGFLLARIAN